MVVTSHVQYCGIASYAQKLLVGVKEESWRIYLNNCADMVKKKVMVLEDGRSHQIEVLGEMQLFMQAAGSEVITDGVMHCQGALHHVNGHWLRNVVIDKQVRVHVTRESYVELNGKVQSETDRI